MLIDPFQFALVAVLERAGKFGCCEEVHEFRLVHPVADEGDDASVLGADERKSRFFKRFAVDAVFGRFPFFELAPDAYPLVLVDVIFFLDAVEQQVFIILLDIAESRVNNTAPNIELFDFC